MPVVVRTLTLTVLYVGAVLVSSRSTDALGVGLLLFLVLVAVALVWGIVDGRRLSAGRALLVWTVTSALMGVVVAVGSILNDSALGWGDLPGELGSDVPFVLVLLLVPAA
ncbi:MAG: hypothetical protein ACXVGH_14515, partial [Mycobacteriales bacterium]